MPLCDLSECRGKIRLEKDGVTVIDKENGEEFHFCNFKCMTMFEW
jgi:ribosomal protein L24E